MTDKATMAQPSHPESELDSRPPHTHHSAFIHQRTLKRRTKARG